MPAAMAGLKPGDRVKSVDGREVKTFRELPDAFVGLFDKPVQVTFERDGVLKTVSLTPQKTVDVDPVEKVERGLIGVSAEPRAAVIGVPAGSSAEGAGLKTFDRIAKINDTAVGDELQLREVVSKIDIGAPMELTVLRTQLAPTGGAKVVVPEVVKVPVTRGEGEGFAALGGSEPGDLYLWNVEPDSPAAKAGLKVGDRPVSIDGKTLRSAQFMSSTLRNQDTKPFKLVWRSGAEEKTAEVQQVVVKQMDELKNEYEVLDFGHRFRPVFAGRADPLAAGPKAEHIELKLGPVQAFVESAKIVPKIIRKIAIVIGKLFTGEVAFSSVGGPVTLYMVATKSAEAGLDNYMSSMAILSINLGLMNLLPIPVLDGFALLAAIWEGIRRRPIPIRAREYANMVGLAMLALLMVMVLKNDISRLLR
jgi:regulator of sigma E protease